MYILKHVYNLVRIILLKTVIWYIFLETVQTWTVSCPWYHVTVYWTVEPTLTSEYRFIKVVSSTYQPCFKNFPRYCNPGIYSKVQYINVRENRRGNQEWTIQRHTSNIGHKSNKTIKHIQQKAKKNRGTQTSPNTKQLNHRKLKGWGKQTSPNIRDEYKCLRKVVPVS